MLMTGHKVAEYPLPRTQPFGPPADYDGLEVLSDPPMLKGLSEDLPW
jgi:hypothetical protein